MVDPVGKGNNLAREAIQAAMRTHADATARLRSQGLSAPDAARQAESVDFAEKLTEGVKSVDADVRRAENLAEDVLTGKVDDFHEVAVQIRRAELSFRFAMEIRNKLIESYREVMRMNV